MRGNWRIVAVTALVAAIGAAAWFGRDIAAFARIGTTYAAKQTCSCLFVSGRPLASCKTDYPADTAKQFTWTVDGNDVTVSAVGGLFSAKATFEDGYGCHPVT
jgi:molybdenum cofactor biosynthesis enzyme